MLFKNTEKSWGFLSVALHWLTAFAVISLFGSGLWMTGLDYYSPWYRQAPYIHKSVGVLLFVLTLIRLVWRIINTKPNSLESHAKIEVIAAHLMHFILYALLFSIMIAGYLISTADGRSVSVFGLFEVPALLTGLDSQEDIAGLAHFYLAWTIILMVALHAGAALKHHVIDKDNTLKRMLGRN